MVRWVGPRARVDARNPSGSSQQHQAQVRKEKLAAKRAAHLAEAEAELAAKNTDVAPHAPPVSAASATSPTAPPVSWAVPPLDLAGLATTGKRGAKGKDKKTQQGNKKKKKKHRNTTTSPDSELDEGDESAS